MELSHILQQIFIVKVYDGIVESFYFSTEDLAMEYINSRKVGMAEEFPDREMKDYGWLVAFTKGEDMYSIHLENDYLDFVR